MPRLPLLLDARMADWSGVGRYETGLVRALNARDDVVLSVLASPSSRRALESRGPLFNTTYVMAKEHPFSPKGIHEISRVYQESSAELLHCLQYCVPRTARDECPIVVTIHDLIPLAVPLSMPNALKRLVYAGKNRQALRLASEVIAPSQATADDITRFFPEIDVPITVISEAADDFGIDPLVEPNVASSYLLAMGNTRAHKNLTAVVATLVQLQQTHPDIHLLLVGQEDPAWLKKLLKDYPHAKGKVHFTGRADDAALRGFYQGAEAFLFPSYYEGFGLPPLEAAAFGTPIIASDVSSIPEVMGDGALLVDPHDVDAWVGAVRSVLEDEQLAHQLGKKAQARARQFSWERAAEETVVLYRKVLEDTQL